VCSRNVSIFLPPRFSGRAALGLRAMPALGGGARAHLRFVALAGGKIGVECEEGKGCTFWFELPVH